MSILFKFLMLIFMMLFNMSEKQNILPTPPVQYTATYQDLMEIAEENAVPNAEYEIYWMLHNDKYIGERTSYTIKQNETLTARILYLDGHDDVRMYFDGERFYAVDENNYNPLFSKK